MAYKGISWLAVAVMLEIAVCSSAVNMLQQQEDDSSSIEKRSLKPGVSLSYIDLLLRQRAM